MNNKKLDNIFYVNSGSEATDNAIKIARKYTNKPNIIAMNKGFHGRTLGALSVTSSNLNCKKGIYPTIPNIYFCNDFSKQSLNTIFEYISSPDDTAAILLEPIQGEGGIYPVNEAFLNYTEKMCQKHNIMLISDEVQCGAMRTGRWWEIDKYNISADILTFGKGIASGFPLAGVISNSDIMNSLSLGSLGGTYGGNAVCSAAASATIDILNNPIIQENVLTMGEYIKQRLDGEYLIKEIRQHGLMIGIEFNDQHLSKYILDELRKMNILVLTSGNNNQYIRLLPPLNIEKNDIDYFLNSFKEILSLY